MRTFKSTVLLFFIYHLKFTNASFLEETYDVVDKHLSSRTPYRFKSYKNDSLVKYPNCKDFKIWMMIRHGARLPKSKDILAARNLIKLREEILTKHNNRKGQLTKKQLQQFENWTIDIPLEEEMFLALEGEDEMIMLAERMQNRFPNAIRQKYHNKSFLFRYTGTQRTQQSARYFSVGLFNKKNAQNVKFDPVMRVDKVLRFYKHCDRWQMQVKKNISSYKEQELYAKSRDMNNTLELVSKRLGLNRILDLDTVNNIYKLCGYETAWDKYKKSPWCYAFDEKTIEVLEYYHDLKLYWVDGYGYELTYRQACVTMKDMFDTFRNERSPRATFFFSHSGTILKFLAYLGLYKPKTPLTGTHVVKNRNWRASDIDTFAANLAFVLFKCEDGDRVLTLHQEKIIRLPMCSQDLCPLHQLTEYFKDSIDNCDYDGMCNIPDKQDESLMNGRKELSITV